MYVAELMLRQVTGINHIHHDEPNLTYIYINNKSNIYIYIYISIANYIPDHMQHYIVN